MERIRTYSTGEVRRAIQSSHEARNFYHRHLMIQFSAANERVTRPTKNLVLDAMLETHKDWVNAKFAPRLSYLQRDAKGDEERRQIRQSFEDHYRIGVHSAVAVYSEMKGEDFDMQDIIVAYTGDFLRMLQLGEQLQLDHESALLLAERSYELDTRSLVRVLHKYDGRFTRGYIARLAATEPDDFEYILADHADTVVALAQQPDYRHIPLAGISYAVTHYPGDPTRYFKRVLTRMKREISEVKKKPEIIVPDEVKKAGEALRLAREAHGVGLNEVALALGVPVKVFERFEQGEFVDINPYRVYRTVTKFIDPDDQHMLTAARQLGPKEIQNWLRTLTGNKKIPKEKRLGRAIRLLRFDFNMSAIEFADLLGLTTVSVNDWEMGEKFFLQESLNKIFQAFGLHRLGTDNILMQYLRLQNREIGTRPGDDEPMSLYVLRMCTFGDLMRYIRRLRGVTQEELATELFFTRSKIENLEVGHRLREAGEDDSQFVESFIAWAGLHKYDSALAKVLRYKAQNLPVPEDILEEVLREQYLFKEHLDQLDSYPLSEKDKDIQPWLNDMTVGDRVQFLRKRKGWTRDELARDIGISNSIIINVEPGKRIPQDQSILKIAAAFGYDDIHNPILTSLLDKVKQERDESALVRSKS